MEEHVMTLIINMKLYLIKYNCGVIKGLERCIINLHFISLGMIQSFIIS